MKIRWLKNPWNWGGVVTIVFIFVLSFLSISPYSIGVVGSQDKILIFSIETLYRLAFNPLWIIVLFCFNKARDLNARYQEKILDNIEGLLLATPGKNIKAQILYNIVYKNREVGKKLEKKFKEEDSVEDNVSSPKI